jgi:hypothetical protein
MGPKPQVKGTGRRAEGEDPFPARFVPQFVVAKGGRAPRREARGEEDPTFCLRPIFQRKIDVI